MASSGQYYTSQRVIAAGEQLFLWWRLVGVVLVLAFIGWAFSFFPLCYPAPSRSHQLIFWLLLSLIFLETIQAGWYRRHQPTELMVLGVGKRAAKWTLYLLVGGLVVWAIVFGMTRLLDSLERIDIVKLWFGLVAMLLIALLVLIVMAAQNSDNS